MRTKTVLFANAIALVRTPLALISGTISRPMLMTTWYILASTWVAATPCQLNSFNEKKTSKYWLFIFPINLSLVASFLSFFGFSFDLCFQIKAN
jgi:hypothetical protein